MFVADTNVISELTKRRPNQGVEAWAAGVTVIAVSVMSVEEIFYGLALRPNARIRTWIERFLDEQCEVLPVTDAVVRAAGSMRGRLAADGRSRTQADLLIGATAQVHALTLVTRNVRDFEGVGIAVLDPFR